MAILFVATSVQWINIFGTLNHLQNVSEATLSAWVKVVSIPATERYIVFFGTNAAATARAALSVRSDTGRFRVNARRVDADGLTVLDGSGTPGQVAFGQTTHVAATFRYATTTNTISLYINGVLNVQQGLGGAGGNTSNTASADVGIGGISAANTRFDGTIEDVRVYQRALSDSEIFGLYTARGRDRNFANCVGLWRMNEGPPTGVVGAVPSSVGGAQGAGVASPVYAASIVQAGRARRLD